MLAWFPLLARSREPTDSLWSAPRRSRSEAVSPAAPTGVRLHLSLREEEREGGGAREGRGGGGAGRRGVTRRPNLSTPARQKPQKEPSFARHRPDLFRPTPRSRRARGGAEDSLHRTLLAPRPSFPEVLACKGLGRRGVLLARPAPTTHTLGHPPPPTASPT